MIKKIISVFSALSILSALTIAPVSAAVDTDTVVYEYDYTQCADGNAVKNKGITPNTTYSYGDPTAQDTVGSQKGVYWVYSTRSADTTGSDLTLATVDFSCQDTDNCLTQVSDNIVVAEVDFGALLKGAASGKTEQIQLRFFGKDENGKDARLATFVLLSYSQSQNGKCYFQTTDPEMTFRAFDGSAIGQRTYVKIYFNMKTQKFSAYAQIKEVTKNGSVANADEELIVEDVPFQCSSNDVVAKYPQKMEITGRYFGQYERFAPISMKLTALAQVETDLEAITPELAESDEQLATGFAYEFAPDSEDAQLGFKLNYPGKTEKDIPISANINGTVKAGIIITATADDGVDFTQLKAKAYIKK